MPSEQFSAGRRGEHMHLSMTCGRKKKKKKKTQTLLTVLCKPGLKEESAYLAVWSVHMMPGSLFTLDNH